VQYGLFKVINLCSVTFMHSHSSSWMQN
jgi:hypothetical protein